MLSSGELSDWFAETNLWIVLALGLVLNLAINGSSIVLWRLTVGRWGLRPVNARDVGLFVSTTVTNAAILVPAWWLWKRGTLVVRPLTMGHVLAEALYLSIVIDAIMYAAHRLFHQGVLYDWFHGVHHADDEPTSFLLFVMHPMEAFGFGAAMVVVIMVWSVSIPAIGFFLSLNLLFGTYAHIPAAKFGSRSARFAPLLWISNFHQWHHQLPMRNFGFFTPVWDVLARTRSDHLPPES